MNRISIRTCLEILKKRKMHYSFYGDQDVCIDSPAQIDKIGVGSMGFLTLNNISKYEMHFNNNNLVILNYKVDYERLPEGNYILTDNPQLAFIFIAYEIKEKEEIEIHPTAIIHPNAQIDQNVSIGAYSILSEKTIIGENSIIFEHCVLNNKIIIGKNVIIQSGCKLGNPGLGSIKDKNGEFHDFPHFGHLIIEDNVVVGDNASIAQGTLNSTIINYNTRIGSNVWIAHGVEIGPKCFIGSGVILAGSAHLGAECWIAPGAIIRDGVQIGDNVTIGLGAVVTKNVPDGETWIGIPAKKSE